MNEILTTSSDTFTVRQFEARDREAVLALCPGDVMHSQGDSEANDVLMDAVEGAIAGKHQMWVAEAFGRIIGSAAIIPNDVALAHLRYLCVAHDFADRHVVARGLAEMAIRDAWERGYLKLVIHTNSPPSAAAALLHELGFEFSRERGAGEEHVLEFYQNLYERPRSPSSQDGRKDVALRHHD